MKIVSILLRVLAVLGAAAAIAGWVLTQNKVTEANVALDKKDQQLVAAQKQTTEALDSIKSLESKVSSISSDLGTSKAGEAQARSQVAQSSREMSELRTDIKEMKKELATLESKNESLKSELIDQRTKVPSAADTAAVREQEDKIQSLNDEIDSLKDQLAKTTRPMADTGTDTKTAMSSGTTTSASGTVAPEPIAPVQKQNASILKVDHKNGIIIISRGQQGGLQRQMEFGIVKGVESPIRVKVSKAEPQYAIARIVPGSSNAKVYQEGDQIQIIQ